MGQKTLDSFATHSKERMQEHARNVGKLKRRDRKREKGYQAHDYAYYVYKIAVMTLEPPVTTPSRSSMYLLLYSSAIILIPFTLWRELQPYDTRSLTRRQKKNPLEKRFKT